MVAVEWADKEYAFDQSVWDLLNGHQPTPLLGPKGESLKAKKTGNVKGTLIGGNLSVLCKLIGTPYMPNLDGCILFLEEVAELPYQVDGLMAQLELSGILGRIGGLVIGDLSPPDSIPNSPSLSYKDVIDRYASAVNGPIATNLSYGHIKSKISMPIGVQAELVVNDSATLNILESVVQIDEEPS
jgi:muramoyltetrapeptide carboxypeptidase